METRNESIETTRMMDAAFAESRRIEAERAAERKRIRARAAQRRRAEAYRSCGMVKTRYGWE